MSAALAAPLARFDTEGALGCCISIQIENTRLCKSHASHSLFYVVVVSVVEKIRNCPFIAAFKKKIQFFCDFTVSGLDGMSVERLLIESLHEKKREKRINLCAKVVLFA